MRHALYEDPVTHRFTVVALPAKFAEGDTLPIPPAARWFATRDEALATLRELLSQDE